MADNVEAQVEIAVEGVVGGVGDEELVVHASAAGQVHLKQMRSCLK